MKVICKKVIVNDLMMKEEEEKILFYKDGKVFEGALFFEWDEKHEELVKVLHEEEYCGDDIPVLKKVFGFYLKHASKVYEDTLSTLQHWQHVNGFSKYIIRDNLFQLPSEQRLLPDNQDSDKYYYIFADYVSSDLLVYSCENECRDIVEEGVIDKEVLLNLHCKDDFVNAEKNKYQIRFKSDDSILSMPRTKLLGISLEDIYVSKIEK